MPRVAKTKAGIAKPKAGVAVKKVTPIKRINKNHPKSETIPLGEILTDLTKKQWKVGLSIGRGGFGDIYSATNAANPKKNLKDYDYVVKIEPHGNGPLFVEMHFFMRNAKLEDINSFCRKKGLKSIGIPTFIGHGSHDLNGKKHRFLVMPRYGKDVWYYFKLNGNRLPQHTIYRLALQMLDVYEYIHDCTYVHGDLKGANIILGSDKNNQSQAYLIDYGLASHYTTKDFKNDPKRMHNGTIEYTSRDAHNGVPTMRSDMEILGYNLIHWSGVMLPWEAKNTLKKPSLVQKSKEDFMHFLNKDFDKLFDLGQAPVPIKEFLQYVKELEYNETPNYEKCRKIFQKGLKLLNKTNSGELDMILKPSSSKKKNLNQSISSDEDDDDADDDENDIEMNTTSPLKTRKRPSLKISPINKTPIKRLRNGQQDTSEIKSSPGRKLSSKFSPVVSIKKNNVKHGKTIVNDNLTPNSNVSKTYEFNFELDVSMDANVVVNVNRKKKSTKDDDKLQETPKTDPVPRVNVRRVVSSTKQESPRQNRRRN